MNEKRKTHCKRGHEFTPDNTRIDPTYGYRSCRICAVERQKRRRESVPLSEHQRVQAELDEARAQAAAMRRALEAEEEFKIAAIAANARDPGCESTNGYRSTYPEVTRARDVADALREKARKSDAGSALLSELADLRRERDAWTEARRLLVATGETTADRQAASQVDDVVQALHSKYGSDLERDRAELADLRARLERAEGRRFPIMGGPSIPWAMIAPHGAQAKINHGQTLERLAERGGLSPLEAVAVLESKRWREIRSMANDEALSRLRALLAEWEARLSAAEVRRAVEEEREACAKAAEVFLHSEGPEDSRDDLDRLAAYSNGTVRRIAAAIRSRGES